MKMAALPIHEGSHVRGKGVVYLCPHCYTILGTGSDSEPTITETGKPAQADAHPENLPADETSHDTAAQPYPEITYWKRQINWPILRTQQELAEIAQVQHRRENVYPPQGKTVGEILIHYGVVDEHTLEVVGTIQKKGKNKNRPIGEILVEIGIINQDELIRTLLIQAGEPMVDILSMDIPPELTENIPLQNIREKLAVPIGQYHNTLWLCPILSRLLTAHFSI